MPPLPNSQTAEIPIEKVRDYLLSMTHLVGRYKAVYFASIGFDSDSPELLETAIRELIESEPAVSVDKTEYGQKYLVRGFIKGPNGRTSMLETVWIVLNSAMHPKFITAYPGG